MDRRPGRFKTLDLEMVLITLREPGLIVVGHNIARYDLGFLNGILVDHGLGPLPELQTQDTMNTLKTGRAYRNSLRAQCERYGVQLKQGAPDWDKILQGDEAEWDLLKSYNTNDVVCALQLERKLDEAGIPCPVRTWRPRSR
jgi:DNA polymerase III epsilon subunit-like protein